MTIFGRAVTVPSDAEAASWVAPRLGEFGTIGGLVPAGFDRAVVLRPLPDRGEPVDDVAHAWAIVEVVRGHTSTPDRTWFAVWEGYGWATSRTFVVVRGDGARARMARWWWRHRTRLADARRSRRMVRGLAEVPTFDLPHRRYHLLAGPLDAPTRMTAPGTDHPQVPDLWWPDDRSWFVASDTDLGWTCVAGSEALVTDLAAAFGERATLVDRHVRNAAVGGVVG